MRVELCKHGALYAGFEFGQSEKGCSAAVQGGMLAMIG